MGRNGLNSCCKNCRHEITISPKSARKRKDTHLLEKYNISLEKYEYMLADQNNCCAICGLSNQDNGKYLDVDHNHKTGAVRGLLCNPCNKGLGCFKDNIQNLIIAAQYLDKFSKKGD